MSDARQLKCKGKVIDAVLGYLGESQTPCLAVSFDTDSSEVKTVAAKVFLTPAAEKTAAKSLTAMGWNPDANNWDIDALIESSALIGREVFLVLEEEEYKGTFRWEVKYINSTTGVMLKTVFDSEARKRLTAEIRARKAPAAGTTGGIKRTNTGPNPMAGRAGEDGQPF